MPRWSHSPYGAVFLCEVYDIYDLEGEDKEEHLYTYARFMREDKAPPAREDAEGIIPMRGTALVNEVHIMLLNECISQEDFDAMFKAFSEEGLSFEESLACMSPEGRQAVLGRL